MWYCIVKIIPECEDAIGGGGVSWTVSCGLQGLVDGWKRATHCDLEVLCIIADVSGLQVLPLVEGLAQVQHGGAQPGCLSWSALIVT